MDKSTGSHLLLAMQCAFTNTTEYDCDAVTERKWKHLGTAATQP